MKDKIHMDVKVYIAGKITGEPVNECVEKFKLAQDTIRGFCKLQNWAENHVVTPFDLPGITFGISHHKAMEICLEALKECDIIYMLNDWKDSPGARMEHELALKSNKEIMYQK